MKPTEDPWVVETVKLVIKETIEVCKGDVNLAISHILNHGRFPLIPQTESFYKAVRTAVRNKLPETRLQGPRNWVEEFEDRQDRAGAHS